MKGQYIQSGDINITNKEKDDDEDEKDLNLDSSDDSLGSDESDNSLDFGNVKEGEESTVDEGFMDEVNSIDEFGSDSPSLSQDEVVEAVQAINQIIEVILATEGVSKGDQPSSEEINFVLDEVQDLAAGFDSAPSDDLGADFGGVGSLSLDTESSGEFDEEGFDENIDEEFPEELESSLVRITVSGKPVKSKFSRPYISPEVLDGVSTLCCSNINTLPDLEEEAEPAKDVICDSVALLNKTSPNAPVVSKFTKVGYFKKWVMQSKAHKLAWKIASTKYQRAVGQSAKTPSEKTAVFLIANAFYNKVLKSSGKKIAKLFSNRSARAIRKVGLALQSRLASHKPLKVLFSDYNGYRNYETWNASLYITKDNNLCNQAKRLVQSGISDYDQFIKGLGLADKKTPDGVAWSSPKIDRGEMKEVLSGLVSSFGGGKMAKKGIRSASQVKYKVDGSALSLQEKKMVGYADFLFGQDLTRREVKEMLMEEFPTAGEMSVIKVVQFYDENLFGLPPKSASFQSRRGIRSATQYDRQGDLVTVQDDTNTGLSMGSQTLSDDNIDDPNTEKVLNIDGGDTSQIVDVDNTGNDGSLEADTDAGTEVNATEYGFDSQEMVGVELPIEGEDNTQVLELKHVGSSVYILNRSFVSPGAGRLSFCKGREAQKLLSRNVRPSPIKANVNKMLTFNDKASNKKSLLLRSSAILGVIAVEAPYWKGLKNAKYSVFSRVGLNLINEEGYYIPMVKGAKNIIASTASNKSVRKGKVIKDVFSEVEGAYVKYLHNKVSRLLKANLVLRSRLNKSLAVQRRQVAVNSQLLNKEHRSARQQVASALQSLDSIKRDTATAEAQRLLASSANAVQDNLLTQKARDEAAVNHLTKMMGW